VPPGIADVFRVSQPGLPIRLSDVCTGTMTDIAFAALARKHWNAVIHVAYCLAGNSRTAVKAATEVFLRVRDDPGSFQEPLRLALYRNVIDRVLSCPSTGDDLHEIIADLDDVDRMAFILRFIEGLPDAHAASMLHVTPDEFRRSSNRLFAGMAERRLLRKSARSRISPPFLRSASCARGESC
jgi:hypothetical protein